MTNIENKYDEKELKDALDICVKAGMLRKFWKDGDWRYIDNRVPPSEYEIWQEKSLKNWVSPDEKEVKRKLKVLEKTPWMKK